MSSGAGQADPLIRWRRPAVPVALIVVLVLVVALAGAGADLFILIARRNRAAHSWRPVDRLLQRRHALIGMVLDDAHGPEAGPVRAARRAAISAGVLTDPTGPGPAGIDPAGVAQAEDHLMTALARLVAATDREPGLRGEARLHAPLDRLRALDGPLQAAIDDFNGDIAAYRRVASRLPGPLLTGAFGLRPLSPYAVNAPDPAPRRTVVTPAGEPA
jgi:hypothetical protein